MMVMSNEETERLFRAYTSYRGVYAHFFGEYDYFKYGGSGPWNNPDSMEKFFNKNESGNFSMQRTIFKNIANTFDNKKDLVLFYLSQFTNELIYPTVFDTDIYDEYKARMNNFDFHIQQDMEEVIKCMKEYNISFDEIFITKSMNHPYILKLGLSKRVSLETFAVLDMILNFIPQIDRYLKDPIWKDYKKLVLNYKPFLEVDVPKMKMLIKDVLMKG